MMKKLPLLLCPIALLFASCAEYNYYQSPFTSNSNPYHAIPLQSDSISGATYINTSVTVGSANYSWKDVLIGFRTAVHRANTFGNFHLYYGANVAVGSYNVSTDIYTDPNTSNATLHGGGRYYGGYGFNGGFNALVPLRNGGEWRVIGLEGSAQREFGDYLNFRRKIPDSAVGVNYKDDWMGTVGITTEIIARRRSGATFGYKLGIGMGISSTRNYATYSTYTPTYVSNTLSFGRDNWLAFCQINLGTYTGNFQFGVNYRIGARKKE